MNNTVGTIVASLKLIGEDAMTKMLSEIKAYLDEKDAKIQALEARIETLEHGNS